MVWGMVILLCTWRSVRGLVCPVLSGRSVRGLVCLCTWRSVRGHMVHGREMRMVEAGLVRREERVVEVGRSLLGRF